MKAESKREKLRAKMGGGEEPTRERGGSEPVERMVPGADIPPNALQPGIVRCPSPPQGSRQREAGRGGRVEGRTPGKEGTTPMAQGTDGHGTHGECKGQGIKQDETKQKQRENQD